MAKNSKSSFMVDTIKNPRKQLDADAAAAFVSGADYTPPAAQAPAVPEAPEKAVDEEPIIATQEAPKSKKEKPPKEKAEKALTDLKGTVEQPWETGSEQIMRSILVQISEASYKKIEYLIENMGTRMSIRKFAIEAVQSRIEDELKKLSKS